MKKTLINLLKTKELILICFIVLLNLVLPNRALANGISLNQAGSNLLVVITGAITLIVELLYVHIAFGRNNKKFAVSVIIGNLISYPLFIYLVKFLDNLIYSIDFENKGELIYWIWAAGLQEAIFISEIAVVLFEMLIFIIILKNQITAKKAFIISLTMNIMSFVGVLIIDAILLGPLLYFFHSR